MPHFSLQNKSLLSLSKFISTLSKKFNVGSGSTWPGHLALSVNPHIIEDLLAQSSLEIILVVGTNGKTTTSMMVSTILKHQGFRVIRNASGANLLNGIVSTLLLHTTPLGKVASDYAVFEVDENNLPLVLEHVTPKVIIALNLFRDQLDRYGELDSIARKWNHAFKKLPSSTTLVLNADDPLIAYLAKDVHSDVVYFGLSPDDATTTRLTHAADSIYCPQCGTKLSYSSIFYSHLGIWECPQCQVKRPKPSISETSSPLPGLYNKSNTLSAVLAAKICAIDDMTITQALHSVSPAFGRQEKLIYKGKDVQLFLSKNPTSMNESLRTISQLGAKTLLLVLNDRIPDGRDVSWIWDIDIEGFLESCPTIVVSGDRTYDMALRIQYAQKTITDNTPFAEPSLKDAIEKSLSLLGENETLFILPTYSAMLEVRKIITGRKIL